MSFRATLLTVLLLALAPLTAAAQVTTACDPGPRDLYVLPASAPGAEYAFGSPTAAHAQVTLYRVRIYDVDLPAAPALLTQDVAPAALTFLGTSPSTGLGCYALPTLPAAQIPPGKRLALTVQAVGAVADLSAVESERGDPFGARLPATTAPRAIVP